MIARFLAEAGTAASKTIAAAVINTREVFMEVTLDLHYPG
jgi:hypothetical protein